MEKNEELENVYILRLINLRQENIYTHSFAVVYQLKKGVHPFMAIRYRLSIYF